MERIKTLKNFFRIDFSDHKEWLMSLPKGELGEEEVVKLADILNEKDPVSETKGQWSVEKLGCAKVIYSGDNNPHLPTHPLYKKIVGIQICDKTRIYLVMGRG